MVIPLGKNFDYILKACKVLKWYYFIQIQITELHHEFPYLPYFQIIYVAGIKTVLKALNIMALLSRLGIRGLSVANINPLFNGSKSCTAKSLVWNSLKPNARQYTNQKKGAEPYFEKYAAMIAIPVTGVLWLYFFKPN